MSTSEGSESPPDQAPQHRQGTAKPVPDENARAKAKDMAKAYEDRPTAVLPGSDRTVTGTAINEWLDEQGRPIYGDEGNAENPS